MLGLSAAVLGTWVERNGPRKAMVVAALCWGIGFMIGSAGIAISSLPLLYLGYGVLGGIGLGIGYISPVSTLIKWFPDRPGLATGLAIMGFGGGALIASPLSTKLLGVFDSGFDPADKASVANGSALSTTFLVLGIAYLVFMLVGAALIRLPHDYAEGEEATYNPGTNGALVRAKQAIRTPQFAFLWIVLFCNVTAGIGILEQAAPMIQDFFRSGAASSVSPAEAAGFVGLLSLANMGGRFVWSSLSDRIGRKRTYMMYLGVGLVLYVLLATLGQTSTAVFVCPGVRDHQLLRRRVRHRPGVPQGPVRDARGRRHPRTPAHRVERGRRRGPAHRQRLARRGRGAGQARRLELPPGADHMVVVLAVGFVANLLIKPVDEKHFDRQAVDAHHHTPETATAGGTR